jgi:hypothetical protein
MDLAAYVQIEDLGKSHRKMELQFRDLEVIVL